MGGEDQLKSLVRQAFSLQNTADRVILDVDALLGQVMLNVKQLVEQLPDENLLKVQAWRELEPLVEAELEFYSQGLKQALQVENGIAIPDMEAHVIREAGHVGVQLQKTLGRSAAQNVIDSVNQARVAGTRVEKLFAQKDGISPWTKSMFKKVDRNVRSGVIQGLTTQEIADRVIHETISRGVPGVSLQGDTSVRKIRQQAMAMSRTVTQDVNRQVKEKVWNDNADQLEGMVYLFSSALDSRTCETCAPLDGTRYKKRKDAPTTPLHVNCRCQVLLIDPDDPFWAETDRNGQQISEKPYTGEGAYKTKIKVNGELYYRKITKFSGNDYADYIAQSNKTTQLEFFGSNRRMQYFRDQINRVNRDPQEILSSMLTHPTGTPKFTRAWRDLDKIKPLKPKLKPKLKALTPPPAPKKQAAVAKAKAVIAKTKPKVATSAGMSDAELDQAILAASKPVIRKEAVKPIIASTGINPVKLYDDSNEILGSGFHGQARLTPKGVAKRGAISKPEIEALRALGDTGYTPKLLGEAWTEPKFTKHYSGQMMRQGTVLLETAPGKTIARLKATTGMTEKQSLKAFDQVLQSRKAMHLRGVAHQDMHQGNVMFDVQTNKLTVIDFGMARVDSRAALIEALGTRRGLIDFGKVRKPGDYQSVELFKDLNPRSYSTRNSASWKRFNANRKKVEKLLAAEGLSNVMAGASIRVLPRALSKGLSQDRALELLKVLYDGV